MPQGLWVQDGFGRVILDLDWRLTRILGVINAVGSSGVGTSGSVTDAKFAEGSLFYYFSPKSLGSDGYSGTLQAWVTASLTGTTLDWSVDLRGAAAQDAGAIIYGVY